MSVLARRAGDDRGYFSRRWRAHGDLVARLPGIRGYVQSHVLGDIDHAGFRVDGFVELWFDSAQAMAEAFASPAALPLIEDEPGFLGHATGYTLAARSLPPAKAGNRLILVEQNLTDRAQELQLPLLSQDMVTAILPKPGQEALPQTVMAFRHYRCDHPLITLETVSPYGALVYPVASNRIV